LAALVRAPKEQWAWREEVQIALRALVSPPLLFWSWMGTLLHIVEGPGVRSATWPGRGWRWWRRPLCHRSPFQAQQRAAAAQPRVEARSTPTV